MSFLTYIYLSNKAEIPFKEMSALFEFINFGLYFKVDERICEVGSLKKAPPPHHDGETFIRFFVQSDISK